MKKYKLDRIPMLENDTVLQPKDWQKRIQEEIHHIKQTHAKSTKKNNRYSSGILDMTTSMEKRRTVALLDSLKSVDVRYQKCADDWITLNLLSRSYASIEYDGHMLKAASIWILDKITEIYLPWKTLYPLLPHDDSLLDDFFDVDLWDCQYDEALIASVEYVLFYRNQDIAPIENIDGEAYRIFTSNLAAEGKDHANVPSRKNFESLIELIPQWKKDEAVKHFKECFEAWTERFFIAFSYIEDQYANCINGLNKVRRENNVLRDKIEKKTEQYAAERKQTQKKQKVSKAKQPTNVLLRNPASGFPKIPISSGAGFKNSEDPIEAFLNGTIGGLESQVRPLFSRMEELDKRHDALAKEYEEIASKRSKIHYFFNNNGYLTQEMAEEYFPEELIDDLVKPLPIDDPYELCFALLYLIETGSDLPWLYGACVGMMSEVIDSLPWGLCEYDESDDIYWDDIPPISKKKPDFPNWYTRDYLMKDESRYEARNLAQIVYETTGCLMPRNLHRYDAELKFLGKYGIRQNKAISILYCMTALSNAKWKRAACNIDPEYMRMLSPDTYSEETNRTQVDESGDWEDQKAKMEKQIQQLRSALHTAEKAAADARKQMEKQRLTAEAEHRELADLREIIFNNDDFDRVDDSTVEIADDKKYPYTIQKSTVVFGGHETWLKSLKPMLKGDIKFIAKEMKIDVSLVRYADVIWVQSNAIPHRSYYSIVNTARKLGKPIRYFTNASAVKCAEQIVENDKR